MSWDAGAPEPLLVASERRALFAFYRGGPEVEDDMEVQVAEFVGYTSVRFGFPNDEAVHGHPLWGAGLDFYAVHEVHDSEWVEQLRAIERHHPQSLAVPFSDSKHYVLTFHDSTLEAVARAISPVSRHKALAEGVAAMARAVNG